MDKDPSGLTVVELSQLEQFHCQPIDSKRLQDTLYEYFEGTFADCYPTFYKQLSTTLNVPTDNSKKYHFYFLVTIDTDQRIFQYRTDRLFRWYDKQSLKDLWTYLKYTHSYNIKIDIQAYCIPISHDDYYKTNCLFQKISKKENYLSLFLDWIFKKKMFLVSGSIAFFPLYILGEIYLNINIPSRSIENSFSSSLPILLDYVLINSLFSWQFIAVFILIIISFIFSIKKMGWRCVQFHRKRIIAFVILLHIAALIWTIIDISKTSLPEGIYIETTGYPKIVQNNNHCYTLLGSNKVAYDLNKSLTAERCANFNHSNKLSPPEVYYSLIRRIDFETRPNSARTLEGNIIYFDYNESLNLIETLCSN